MCVVCKVDGWTANIVEQTLKKLTALGKPFKYIGTLQPVSVLAVLLPLTTALYTKKILHACW